MQDSSVLPATSLNPQTGYPVIPSTQLHVSYDQQGVAVSVEPTEHTVTGTQSAVQAAVPVQSDLVYPAGVDPVVAYAQPDPAATDIPQPTTPPAVLQPVLEQAARADSYPVQPEPQLNPIPQYPATADVQGYQPPEIVATPPAAPQAEPVTADPVQSSSPAPQVIALPATAPVAEYRHEPAAEFSQNSLDVKRTRQSIRLFYGLSISLFLSGLVLFTLFWLSSGAPTNVEDIPLVKKLLITAP